jgi:excisionase family DNA binding protein
MTTINNIIYLTVKESAELLNVAPLTIRRWIDEGKINSFRMSERKILLKKEDLLSLTGEENKPRLYVTDKRREQIKSYKEKAKSAPYYHLVEKTKRFQSRSQVKTPYTHLDVIEKFGKNPVCYLSGLPINYDDSTTYQLDHFIPVSNGGSSDLENMRLSNPMANQMKRDYDLIGFIKMCALIAERNEHLI